ncbi:MAG: hypothetical protein JRN15_13175 [Nitrososphaerota archaeon]|nr:hypothetical protein [Nitrososphaerota archaeon]
MGSSLNNSQKTISFLSIVNSSIGPVNVNFDAETEEQTLDAEEYSKVYDLGVLWSETFQASKSTDSISRSAEIKHLLRRFGKRFSANLVIGNAAYGLKPDYDKLHKLTLKLAPLSSRELKLGAEGALNGKRAIDLAATTGSVAYILHTNSIDELIDYARSRGVHFMVYTLCRIAESRSKAAAELMHIKGVGYFERRRVLREEISTRLGEFSIFGTGQEIAAQINTLVSRGADKIVLYPVFENTSDLIRQMNMLSEWVE